MSMPDVLRERAARYRRMMDQFTDAVTLAALRASAINLEREAQAIEDAAENQSAGGSPCGGAAVE